MSYNWSFHSFDYDKFEHALLHSREKVVDAVLSEIRQFTYDPVDFERHAQVGKRLVASGFAYGGWPTADFKIIDRFIFDFFHVCAADINFEPESPEFLSPSATVELPSFFQRRFFWSRPRPIPADKRDYFYLPFFQHGGRRLREEISADCEYIALDLQETHLLKRELEKFLASPEGQELDLLHGNNVRNGFLEPVLSATSKGKALHGQLS